MTENVKEFVNYKAIPFEKLVKANWNYKTEDEEQTKKLVANIKRIGQVENILVRQLETSFYEVINGNHRYDAFEILDAKTVFCFDFGDITEAQAKRIAVETNETKWQADTIKLAEIMTEITKEFDIDELVLTMPYTQEEITNFGELLEFDWDSFKNEDSTESQDEQKRVNCPKCGHEFTI